MNIYLLFLFQGDHTIIRLYTIQFLGLTSYDLWGMLIMIMEGSLFSSDLLTCNLHKVRLPLYKSMMSFEIYTHVYLSLPCSFSVCCPLHPWPLVTTAVISVPFFSPFAECHINGIMQCVVFCVWLIFLSIRLLGFIQVVTCISSLFLFLAE